MNKNFKFAVRLSNSFILAENLKIVKYSPRNQYKHRMRIKNSGLKIKVFENKKKMQKGKNADFAKCKKTCCNFPFSYSKIFKIQKDQKFFTGHKSDDNRQKI